MIVSGPWLARPATQRVLRMLANAGHQAYAVGGCVRNQLLGLPVADVDIATDALPDQVLALAGQTGLKAVPTGLEHGTITVVAGDTGFEVTTFRADVQTDGRHAVVAFSTSLEADARRRDFTINALYVSADGQVQDPLNGLRDIQARRVRFIDDPTARITEDYLRILRFFRFQAWFGDPSEGIDAEALAACAEQADGIENLSKERIGAEMAKLLAAPDPAPALASMQMTGILARVLPGANANTLAPLVHWEAVYHLQPDWIRRLAALGGQDQTDALRLSRLARQRLSILQAGIGSPDSIPEYAYRHDAETACDIALLRAAILNMPPPQTLLTDCADAAAQVFPVKAQDLMPAYTGPALGKHLTTLEKRWIASGFRLTKAQLLA